jgi:hypothetical protein
MKYGRSSDVCVRDYERWGFPSELKVCLHIQALGPTEKGYRCCSVWMMPVWKFGRAGATERRGFQIHPAILMYGFDDFQEIQEE